MVPDEASVVAQAAIVPHLSTRLRIHMLDAAAPEADYVVMSDSLSPWPAANLAERHEGHEGHEGLFDTSCSS